MKGIRSYKESFRLVMQILSVVAVYVFMFTLLAVVLPKLKRLDYLEAFHMTASEKTVDPYEGKHISYVGSSKLEIMSGPSLLDSVVHVAFQGEKIVIVEKARPLPNPMGEDRSGFDAYWVLVEDVATGAKGYAPSFYIADEHPYEYVPMQVVSDEGAVAYKFPNGEQIGVVKQGDIAIARYLTIWDAVPYVRVVYQGYTGSTYGYIKEADLRAIDMDDMEFYDLESNKQE